MRKNKEICSCFVGENNTKRRRKIKKRRTFLKFCGRFSVIPCVGSRKISQSVYKSTENKMEKTYLRLLALSFRFAIIISRKIQTIVVRNAFLL